MEHCKVYPHPVTFSFTYTCNENVTHWLSVKSLIQLYLILISWQEILVRNFSFLFKMEKQWEHTGLNRACMRALCDPEWSRINLLSTGAVAWIEEWHLVYAFLVTDPKTRKRKWFAEKAHKENSNTSKWIYMTVLRKEDVACETTTQQGGLQ